MVNLTHEEAVLAASVLGSVCRQTSHLVPITQELIDLVDQLQAVLAGPVVEAKVVEVVEEASAE